MSDWKPDPKLGGEHVEARKKEAIEHLKKAADVAFYHIEQQTRCRVREPLLRRG
jgi:hypothetical protein